MNQPLPRISTVLFSKSSGSIDTDSYPWDARKGAEGGKQETEEERGGRSGERRRGMWGGVGGEERGGDEGIEGGKERVK